MSRKIKSSTPTNFVYPRLKPAKEVDPRKKGSQIFRGKTFAITGDFGPWKTHICIERWITCHSGQVAKGVTGETTHLICSVEDYKKRTVDVKKALSLGKEKCKIVVFDWLEDCLVRKRPRYLSEKAYLLESVLKRVRVAEKRKIYHAKEYIANIELTRELADPLLYAVYYDTTFFRYEVRLCRISLKPKLLIEQYTIYLFESNALPHVYMVGAKYQKSRQPAVLHRALCFPKQFCDAWADFTRLFKKKTDIDWDQRLDVGLPTTPEAFKYSPPEDGKPRGLLPLGWTPPQPPPTSEEDEGEDEDEDEGGSSEGDEDEEDDDEEGKSCGEGDDAPGLASTHNPPRTDGAQTPRHITLKLRGRNATHGCW